jgi:aminopeptidase N
MKKLNFQPTAYHLELNAGKTGGTVLIEGLKLPPPSKRISLHQSNLKITNATIIHKSKKGNVEIEVSRINHIKSFEEVRLHTDQILYPGTYTLNLHFTGTINQEKLRFIDNPEIWQNTNWRDIFPSIDEPDARKTAVVKLI